MIPIADFIMLVSMGVIMITLGLVGGYLEDREKRGAPAEPQPKSRKN